VLAQRLGFTRKHQTGDSAAMTQRPSSYDSVSKWLHWTTAVLLVAGFFIGENTSHRFADGVG
jgi:cytochrome b